MDIVSQTINGLFFLIQHKNDKFAAMKDHRNMRIFSVERMNF